MIRPLYLIGNKRSGTSQLVRVLNLHPQVFVSHESDIAWILFQLNRDQPFRAHPWDSDRGMRVTLASSGHLLRREASPRENFHAVQTSLMENGSPWLAAQSKKDLRWIGDKKPMQHTDPDVLNFLLHHFPDAHFLHLVRHPLDVVASSDRFNGTADGDFWLGLSREEKLARWAFHERQVLQLRESLPARVHSLRYEDFCCDTVKQLTEMFQFLQVNPDPEVLRNAASQTYSPGRTVSAVTPTAQAISIASMYGYDLSGSIGSDRSWLRSMVWSPHRRFAKKS
jgi:hypothetical protein